jgi:hypothetical protein
MIKIITFELNLLKCSSEEPLLQNEVKLYIWSPGCSVNIMKYN